MSSRPPSTLSNRSEAGEPSERAPLLGCLEGRMYSDMPSTPADETPRTPGAGKATIATTPLTVITVPTPGPPTSSKDKPIARHKKWVSIIALTMLCGGVLAVLCVGFFVPATAEQYAQEAVSLDLSSLSVDSFTEAGVKVRVRANVDVDARRVKNWYVRTIGRVGTAMVRSVHVNDLQIKAWAPNYHWAFLGEARVPAMTIDLQNGHTTILNFVADIMPPDVETIRLLAAEYLSGNLHTLNVVGAADLTLKKGFLWLNRRDIFRKFTLSDLPSLPAFDLTKIYIQEVQLDNKKAILANVSVVIENPYPFALEVPPLGFQVSIPGCDANSRIKTAAATTSDIIIKSRKDILVDASGLVQSLPAKLVAACPGSDLSPMDLFLGNYLHGQKAIVFVSGDGSNKDDRVPEWLVKMLSSVTVPVPFPGHNFENVIRSFSLSHVNIKLPDGNSDAPMLSATIEAIIALPEEMNLPLNITKLKATADTSYLKKKFGTLDIKDWIPAESERVPDKNLLRVRGVVRDAPLNVSNYEVFSQVIQKMLFGGGNVNLGINGTADAGIDTFLGDFVVHDLPASGNITLDVPKFGNMPHPKLNDIKIDSSTEKSMNLIISVSMENPTPWEAVVPYSNLLLSHDGFVLGNGTVRDLHLTKGVNNITVEAAWDPITYGGEGGLEAAEKMMGHYISGHNISLTLSTHKGSFPSIPALGKALENIKITIPAPRLGSSNPSEPPAHFIESATMHLFSSSADFVIKNPLPHNGILMHVLDGEAIYEGSTLGTINYTNKFLIKPGKNGATHTPRLPVNWNMDSVGYDAMWAVFGGDLKIYAQAWARLSIGNCLMRVFYNGSEPIGAHIRI